jgi:hypothetical protein
MSFDEFWIILSRGGVSAQGDRYSVTPDGRLHIQSPSNSNPGYHITRQTAERYFCEDIPNMTGEDFRYYRSTYFHNIYLAITQARRPPNI